VARPQSSGNNVEAAMRYRHVLAAGFIAACILTGAVCGAAVTAVRCVIGAGNG
jgi:hypothetical protein